MATAPPPDRADTVRDLLEAVDFVQARFSRWQQDGDLRADQLQELDRYYKSLRLAIEAGDLNAMAELRLRPPHVCWDCRETVDPAASACPNCGAPVNMGEVRSLRHLQLLRHEIKKHEREGRLNLAAVHFCLNVTDGWINSLYRKLDRARVPLAQAVRERRRERLPESKPAVPRRPLLEILLDPRSIQWLLALGGALLVLGLIIWLAAAGIFQNKLFVAVLLGVGNGSLLVGGWGLLRYSRYQTAGRALTLLACLLMPFNLWFYDAQGLITIRDGGHLWLPALVCCVLYAVSARVLRDPMFVYVLVGGVALTGLLLLADRQLKRFWEVAGPSTLLVGLGLVCLHVERLFPEVDGDFSRRRFGLAFFWSGQAVLAAGLLLLLGAQVCGGLLWGAFRPLYESLGFGQPWVVTDTNGKLLALALVAAGTYAYVYSDLVVRRVGVYLHLAVFTLLWAEVLVLNLLPSPLHPLEMVILVLSLTGLVANLTLSALARRGSNLLRAGPPLGLFLCALPVVLGVWLHFRATSGIGDLNPAWKYDLGWGYVVAMLAAAVSCRVGAYLFRRENPGLSMLYFFGTGAATLAGLAGLLLATRLAVSWEEQAPLLMLLPIAYRVAAQLYRGHTPERPLIWVSHVAAGVMLLSSLGATFKGFTLVQEQPLNRTLALFFTEAAVFYGLSTAFARREETVYACTAAACAAVWQLFKYLGVADEYYTLAFALLGLALLVAYRFALVERFRVKGLAPAVFQCANVLLSLAFVVAGLMTLGQLLAGLHRGNVLLWLLPALAVISLAAVYLVRHQDWRRWYVATTVANVVLTVLVLAVLSNLTRGQKFEVVCLVTGAILLTAGHVGLYREREGQNDLVSLGLVFGCLLIGLPLTVAVLYCRSGGHFGTFHTLNELGMLAAGLLLLATGFMFQIRATALTGGLMTFVYLASLLLFVRLPHVLQTTAVYLIVGGGAFFGVGLLLSIYRDRLLTLPERIRRREGVFRVLSWR
jgi:hypothetical protein